jgi:hypothetical protein
VIQPKTVEIPCQDGSTRSYVISKFPAIEGREIVTQYVATAIQKADGYKANEDLMLKAMCYVSALNSEGQEIKLTTRALVNNHVPDFEALMRLEAALLDYNTNFMHRAKSFISSSDIEGKAMAWISRMLTHLSAQSSVQGRQPSETSGSVTRSKKRTT